MTSLADRHLYPIFMLPSKMLIKFRGWIYGYIRLLLGMVCSVSCIFCVFTFIWYLTFRGLYGFLINLQFCQPPNGYGPDDDSDLTLEYTDYQPGKRGSFLTRCRAQAELIQQTLQKNRSNGGGGDKSPNGNCVKLNNGSSIGDEVKKENNGTHLHHHHHHHRCSNHNHNSPVKENSSHGLLVRNSSYVSEIYYDENGHKIGEQIYLTNDSNGLEESYFQFKVNDVQHLKEIGALSTSVLVEEEHFQDGEQLIHHEEIIDNVEIVDHDQNDDDKHAASGEGGNFVEKINGDGMNGVFGKGKNLCNLSIYHSPESTTSIHEPMVDEPSTTFEDDSSAKTVIIDETSPTITCSTTIIPTTIKLTNNQPQQSILKTESLQKDSNFNNHRKLCSITAQLQSNKNPIKSIAEEETKDIKINLVKVPEQSKINCNEKPNGVQLNDSNENITRETISINNLNDSQSKSLNGGDENLIKDQPTLPSKKSKRKRRNNNNYYRRNS